MSERWIIVENWDEFQHYKDRDPKWVKVWCKLLRNDDYLELSFHVRGVLHGVWMAYATANGQLRDTTATLHRLLGHRVLTRDISALNHAGFITLSDTKPSALRTPETEKYQRKKLNPPDQKPLLSTPGAGLGDSQEPETLEQLSERLASRASEVGSEGRLFEVLTDMDEGSPAVIRAYLSVLPARTIEEVREEVLAHSPRSPVRYAVGMLQKRANGRGRVA